MTVQSVGIVGVDAGTSSSADRLLALLGWIRREHAEVEVHVLLLRGGPRIHRFHELAPTTVVDWYDRRTDLQGGAVVLRGERRQRWLAALIDRYASATLARKLPRLAVDVVLVSGWEAAEAGPLGADPGVPLVVLLADGETRAERPAGVPVPAGGRRRARRALRRAEAVLVDPAGAGATDHEVASTVWAAIGRAGAR